MTHDDTTCTVIVILAITAWLLLAIALAEIEKANKRNRK